MLKTHPLSNRGFTLAEMLVAVGMGTIFLVSAISTWIYSTKTWKSEGVRSELRYNLEKSLEKMKEDIRLSDGGKIMFYPTGGATYDAVSIPREYVNSSGLYDISSGITWQDTVIYHVYNNELRRTAVAYNASSSTRQTQVDEAATTGGVSGGTTESMFSADAVTMGLTPTSPEFDGYSSSLQKSSNTTLEPRS
jgi:prepilin-type N-terminal cleavage/methylation domain-containing protein